MKQLPTWMKQQNNKYWVDFRKYYKVSRMESKYGDILRLRKHVFDETNSFVQYRKTKKGKLVRDKFYFSVDVFPQLNAVTNIGRYREKLDAFHRQVLEIINLVVKIPEGTATQDDKVVVAKIDTQSPTTNSSKIDAPCLSVTDRQDASQNGFHKPEGVNPECIIQSTDWSRREIEPTYLESNGLVPPEEKLVLANIKPNEKNLYDARKLHWFLEVKTKFTDWISRKIVDGRFTEGTDYVSFSQNWEKPQGGRPEIEYWISARMAAHLGQMEHNDKGKEVRQYFIDKVEEKGKSFEELMKASLYELSQVTKQNFVAVNNEIASVKGEVKKLGDQINSPAYAGKVVDAAYKIPDDCISLPQMRNDMIPGVSKERISEALNAFDWDKHTYPHSSKTPGEVNPGQAFKKVIIRQGREIRIEEFAKWFIRESEFVGDCEKVYKMNLQYRDHSGRQKLNMNFQLDKKSLDHSVWGHKVLPPQNVVDLKKKENTDVVDVILKSEENDKKEEEKK